MMLFCSILVLTSVLAKIGGHPLKHDTKKPINYTQSITYVQPEQVHISLGFDPTQMFITWTTMSSAPTMVEYGINSLVSNATGNETLFTDGGSKKREMYIHRVLLKDLTPNTAYMYHCGSSKGWSSIYFFRTIPDGSEWSPRLALFGDMGSANAQSMARLQQETQRGHFDAILHVGDFGYDLSTDDALVGDQFMRQVESMAAYVPYMTSPGNHEYHYNFSNYKNRFTMPGGDGEGMFYSYDLGKAHIISINSEVFYWAQYGWDRIKTQYNWVVADLKKANEPQNRKMRPWLIVLAHRPMYCSNNDGDSCTHVNDPLRMGYEKLFYENGVDLMVWAHEHSYERMWPTFDQMNCNGSTEFPYTNPKGPVHITTGSAGCREIHDGFGPAKSWTAYRSSDYGYSRMTIHNSTHLYWDQVSDDKNGEVVDKIWFVQENHGPGLYKCHMQRNHKIIFNPFTPSYS